MEVLYFQDKGYPCSRKFRRVWCPLLSFASTLPYFPYALLLPKHYRCIFPPWTTASSLPLSGLPFQQKYPGWSFFPLWFLLTLAPVKIWAERKSSSGPFSGKVAGKISAVLTFTAGRKQFKHRQLILTKHWFEMATSTTLLRSRNFRTCQLQFLYFSVPQTHQLYGSTFLLVLTRKLLFLPTPPTAAIHRTGLPSH